MTPTGFIYRCHESGRYTISNVTEFYYFNYFTISNVSNFQKLFFRSNKCALNLSMGGHYSSYHQIYTKLKKIIMVTHLNAFFCQASSLMSLQPSLAVRANFRLSGSRSLRNCSIPGMQRRLTSSSVAFMLGVLQPFPVSEPVGVLELA